MGICCYKPSYISDKIVKIADCENPPRKTISHPFRQNKTEEHYVIKIKKIWKIPGVIQDFSLYFKDKNNVEIRKSKSITKIKYKKSNSINLLNTKKNKKKDKSKKKLHLVINGSNLATKDTSNFQSNINHNYINFKSLKYLNENNNNVNNDNSNNNLCNINTNSINNNFDNNKNYNRSFNDRVYNIHISNEENLSMNYEDKIKEEDESQQINDGEEENINNNMNDLSKNLSANAIEHDYQNPIKQENGNSNMNVNGLNKFKVVKVSDKEISIKEEFNIKDIFRKLYLFDVFPENALNDILSSLFLVHISKEDILLEKGVINRSFFIVLKGELDLFDEHDENIVTKTYKSWDYFGYSSLMNQNLTEKINNKIVAKEDSDLFVLDGEKFLDIQEKMIKQRLEERFEYLNNIIFFKSLDPFQKHNIAEKMNLITVKKDTKIISKGEISKCIYLIKRGKVSCIYNNKECRELGESCYIGIISILMKTPRNLEAFTKENCTFFTLSDENLRDALGNNYIEAMLMSIFREYINSNSTISDLINRSNIDKVFSTFSLKKYEKNEKLNGKNPNLKRVILVLEGNLVNCSNMKICHSAGNLLGEETLTNNVDIPSYLVAYPECFTFEANLEDFSDLLGEDFRATTIHLLHKVIKMKKIPFLNSISENTLKSIVNDIKKEKFFPNQKIIEEDKEVKGLYIIIKGIISMSKNDKIFRHLEKDSIFGELGLLSENKTYQGTVTALTNVSCYIIKTKDFFKAYEDDNVKKFLEKEISLINFDISLKDLFFIKSIGHGKFGEVSLVHNNKYIYACKSISRKDADRKKRAALYLINERRIMLSLDHPFIVKMVRSFKSDNFVFFLMEYVNGCSLKELLRTINLNKNDTRFYIASLLAIIEYIHKKKIIQRDIKTNNIMVDKNGYVKMIDFGISKIMQDYTNSIVGTPHYMAPEVLSGKGYTFSCDYWSIGICAFEIFYKKFPFGDKANEVMDIYNDIIYSNYKYPVENEINKDLNEFINLMLIKQVNKRLCSVSKILKLDFFANFKWEELLKFKLTPPIKPDSLELKKINLKNFHNSYEAEIENSSSFSYTNSRIRDGDGTKWADEF